MYNDGLYTNFTSLNSDNSKLPMVMYYEFKTYCVRWFISSRIPIVIRLYTNNAYIRRYVQVTSEIVLSNVEGIDWILYGIYSASRDARINSIPPHGATVLSGPGHPHCRHFAITHVIEVCRQLASGIRTELLASCQQICVTYTTAVCTVKNSWWWTEEQSETCRIYIYCPSYTTQCCKVRIM